MQQTPLVPESPPTPKRWTVELPQSILPESLQGSCERVLHNIYQQADPGLTLNIRWAPRMSVGILDAEPPLSRRQLHRAQSELAASFAMFGLTAGMLYYRAGEPLYDFEEEPLDEELQQAEVFDPAGAEATPRDRGKRS
ncbi:MAG: hypothetical protein AAGD01_07890 [Acidobacteriota bacterium]